MGYFGYLASYRYAHEVAQDPLFAQFLLDYMDKEATPTLQPVPGMDLETYKRTLIERFSNEDVRDTLARLCAEGSDRIPKWLLPVIRINLEQGGEIQRSAAIVASWARYDEGTDEQGNPIDVVDRLKEPLMAAAARQREEPLAFIANREVFGDLVGNEDLSTSSPNNRSGIGGGRHASPGPFKGCDDVSFVRECLLFGRGKFVVGVGGDGHR
jgi:mannitol 2-dehydrogenase